MTELVHSSPAGRLAVPAGVGRWVTAEERKELTPPQSSRLALERAVGEDSESIEYVRAWLNEIRSENTRTAYSLDALALVDWLREKHGNPDAPLDLRMIGRGVLAEFAAHIRETASAKTGRPLSPSSQARRMSAVSSLLGYMVETGAMPHNAAKSVRRPTVSREGKTHAPLDAEVDRLVLACRTSKWAARDSAFVATLSVEGMRVSELRNADVTGMSTESGRRVLTIRLKGEEDKKVQIDPAVAQVLDVHIGERTDGPLILNNQGGRLTLGQTRRILERLSAAAGVPTITAHMLRAAAITALLEGGAPIHEVQHLVGHKSPDTTGRYHRRRNAAAKDAALAATLASRLPSLTNDQEDA